jgi:hypothetical protein
MGHNPTYSKQTEVTMNKFTHLVVAILLMAISGCVPKNNWDRFVNYSAKTSVIDIDNNPVQNATAKVELKQAKVLQSDFNTQSESTDNDGEFNIFITTESYNSPTMNITFKKDGYYSKSVEYTFSSYGSHNKSEKITMYRPTDYIDKSFIGSKLEQQMRVSILSFVNTLLLQGIVSDALVKPRSIRVNDYKGKRYLSVTLDSTNVYNSLKLNKYDIGKMLFDEVVRKILNPLNAIVVDKKSVTGYDVSVIGHHKSFLDKYASATTVNYRFIMPELSVRKYKEQEISGQRLLDDSVILMDDERIDLRLQ